MKRLRLRGEARAELLHEMAFYESRRPGTGRRFREAVGATFDLVRRFPSAGAPLRPVRESRRSRDSRSP
ncbi:MAG: hypothetical protein J0L57_10450 [Burkholderiales bacterium]|nr:hypothetical protein [Burkholderiales bacterium]